MSNNNKSRNKNITTKKKKNSSVPIAISKMNKAKDGNTKINSGKRKTPEQIRREERQKKKHSTSSRLDNKYKNISVEFSSKKSNVKKKVDSSNFKDLKKQKRLEKKERKRLQKNKKKSVKKVILSITLTIILFILLVGGLICGVFYGIIDEQTNINPDDIQIKFSNSKIVTSDGTQVLAELSGDEKRKIVSIDQMSPYLPKAYVAIEDERFYQHKGVDLKRTSSAIFYSLIGKSSYGGSTITQQLIKNLYDDKEQTYDRKIREWFRAYKLEKLVDDKEKILEQYLNVLFVGGQMHGVELGAEYYFAKEAKDLDLAECAFLAGINHKPNAYNPYSGEDNAQIIKNRTLTVLDKMYELGFITLDEKDQASQEVNNGLKFERMQNPTNVYSYHTDAIIDQLTKQLMTQRNMTKDQAETYIYGSGLTIYSAVDTNIQNILETELGKTTLKFSGNAKKDGVLVNDSTQAAMVVIDYKNGYVVGCVGGLGQGKTSRGLNRATQTKRQVGSSIKPIASVAPALEEKVIQASTVYNDVATEFSTGGEKWRPKNQTGFKGLINIRQFIQYSQNIPSAKIMTELTPAVSLEYLEKLGITSLDSQDDVLALALGGQYHGISVLDMATAYGTIANGGVRVTPTFYIKVLDSNGEEILKPNQEKVEAISPQNAYITQQILREPVYTSGGTATYCAINGIETGAKTGTTDDDYDRWLCGITPYYSAACWFGYDINEEVKYKGTNPAGQIWSNAMKQIHSPLSNAQFERPYGIIEKQVCKTTGLLPGAGCATRLEIFTEDNLPDTCKGHGIQTLCAESNLVATPYCPQTIQRSYGATLPKEELGLWKTLGVPAGGSKITSVCTIHQAPVVVPTPNTSATPNTSTTPSTPTTPANPSTTPPANTTKPTNGSKDPTTSN